MRERRIVWSLFFIAISLCTVLAMIILNKGYFPRLLSSSPMTPSSVATTVARPGEFVTRSGTQLMLNGNTFRFAGANMHWLPFDDSTNYTSQFRINDGFDAAREMGLTVVRAHNLGISVGCSNCIEPALGVFNNTAFAHDDYVIKAAHDHGMRLIIPLTDNWHYPAGGKHTFTDWRGIADENQFYSNAQVISDFKTYISALLNHVNAYTGIAYKNDPTIMAWETGNELDAPTSWTQAISMYIKSIDPNHLVVDGRTGVNPLAANLTDVDIVSDHYYPKNIGQFRYDASAAQRSGKAFIVGEFDWNDGDGGDTLSSFLSAVESDSRVAGDAFWELWPHADEYGYVNSGDSQYRLHYPGDSTAMRASVQQLRYHAYDMRRTAVQGDSVPGVPVINLVVRNYPDDVLVWRGTAVAASYTVERSRSADGPWIVICDKCATDASTPWTDETTPEGALWYRVIANNLSEVAGPPSIPYQAGSAGGIIVDQLDNLSQTYASSSNIGLDKSNAVYMRGDTSRAVRVTSTHEFIIWKQARMVSFQAIAYFWPGEPVSHFSLYTSSDGWKWTPSHPAITNLGGNWIEYVYTLNGLSGVNYVKMVWNNTEGHSWNPNLGEVTISY